MSDELSEMVRAAAHDEAAAAEREFPYSSATLGRFVGDVRRRRAVGGAMLAVAGVAVVGMAVLGLGRPWQATPPAVTPMPSPTPSASASPTPTPTVEPTPTAIPTTPPPESPAPPPPQETTPPPPVEALPEPPGAVSGVHAHPGGGSGEILVLWDTMTGATGYRVYRSGTPDGPFAPAASIDVTTGVVTIEYGGRYEYIGIGEEGPTSLRYTEAIGTFGYFWVAAFNAGGQGPASGIVCAEPQNGLSPEVSEC